MKASYWQRGEALDYRNSTENKIEAGTVLVIGKRIGVAGTDILPGETGSVHVSGIFEFTKADNAAVNIGTEVYFTEDGITATAGDAPAGYAAAEAAAESKKILIKINA